MRNKKDKLTRKERKAIRRAKRIERARHGGPIARMALRIVTEYDYLIVLYVTILVVFGVIMVFSAGYYSTVNAAKPDPYYYLKRQGFFAVIGFILMTVTAQFDYHRYKALAIPLAVTGFILLLLLMTPLGISVNFATRWIAIGPIRITPSEICKLTVIIFTSVFLAANPMRVRRFSGVTFLLVFAGVHAALIIWQPNLSTAIVIMAIAVGIMFIAGLSLGYIGALFAVGAGGTLLILTKLQHTHWYSRLTNWIDPFADSQGAGYQVSQSIIALGNGGIFGRGLGNSVAKNLYLPEPQNDFILAIIGEELGFVGFFLLMCLYLLLVWECIRVAGRVKDKLGLYLASGIAIMLALQVIINVAVVTASMPATGITLPFISYGGTSLWIFMIAMGIMLNISKVQNMRSMEK